MTYAELKEYILENILSDDLLILQYSDCDYIPNQYAATLADKKDLEIKYVDSLDDVNDYLSSYPDYCPFLFVIHTDTFDELKQDYSIYINTVIICNKVSTKVTKLISEYIVKFEKPTSEDLHEFIYELCPGLTYDDATTLCQVTQNNTYKIANTLEQIALFDGREQHRVFNDLLNVPGTELYFNTAFTLVDALQDMTSKKSIVAEILKHRNCCDITAMFVLTLLNNALRYKAIICCGGKVSCNSFKGKDGKSMSAAYFNRIKNSFSYNPNSQASKNQFERLKKNLDFLSSVDAKIKLGQLELSDEYLLDYIITHIC